MTSATAPRRRRLSAEARQMLPWCFAWALAGHMLLLAVIASSPRGSSEPPGRPGARTVSVRLIPPGSTPLLAGSDSAPAAVAVSSAPTSPAATAASAATPANAVPPTAAGPWAAGALAEAATAATGESRSRGEGGYVPRPLLSIVPEPVIPVIIPTPASGTAGRLIGRYRGVLALYIDEAGRVRRVEAEPPALPEPMERAAREAFLAARFSPGQVAGQVVKSRIRVEVVFDDASAPAMAASAASAASRAGEGASAASGVQRSP